MTDVGAYRQQRLLEALACPRCNSTLDLLEPTVVEGAVVDADLECATCGTVGVIRSCRPSFLQHDLGDNWSPRRFAERPIDFDGVTIVGDWSTLAHGHLGTAVGSCLTGVTTAPGIAVHFGTHQWGGTGVVTLGRSTSDTSLYSFDPGLTMTVVMEPSQAGASRRWSVLVAPSSDPLSGGSQGIVTSVAELVPASAAPPPCFVPVNRGNPYPERFGELLAELPDDAVVIDIGGGDRCHTDPRVLNFEYMKFPAADFFGDGLRLPLATNSVDLILSQAVLEHVPEPQRAVDELRRVLRPTGRLYCEFAFMQPLHAVPYHFFNITPHGAALLFANWNVERTGTFGGLSETVGWFFRLLDADTKIGSDETAAVLQSLARLDSQLTDDALDYVASAVYVESTPGD
jgi:SAM-dependent methyltransferase/uncharacterized protein YbaR (Trm112 family)